MSGGKATVDEVSAAAVMPEPVCDYAARRECSGIVRRYMRGRRCDRHKT